MNVLINVVAVMGVVIVALYLAPFLIGLIATGIVQIVMGVAVVYLLFKTIYSSNTRDFDKF